MLDEGVGAILSKAGYLPPQRTGLVWPNSLGSTNDSQLTLVHSTGNTASMSYRGPWSLFRLLSRGHLNGRTDTRVDLTFAVADGLMRYRIGAEKANSQWRFHNR